MVNSDIRLFISQIRNKFKFTLLIVKDKNPNFDQERQLYIYNRGVQGEV